MFESFFSGRKVMITGADGFMGSHLTERLLELGAETAVLIRPESAVGGYRLKNLAGLKGEIEIMVGDIGSSDVIRLIEESRSNVIFHLAALAYVNYSFSHPFEVMRVNLNGTLCVLEAARRMEVDRVVVTSSSEVYGPALTPTIDEGHPMNPTSPYAASKAAADRCAHSYWRTFGLPVAIIRPFNTYGPRHTYDVIPKFIEMVLRGEPPTIYGSGEQSRDFTYVTDMVEAFLHMGSGEKAVGEAVNFGSGKAVKIKDLTMKIIELADAPLDPVYLPERPAEVTRLCCNYGKARRIFGWEPKVSLREGLKKNIEWFREAYSLA